MLSLFSRLFLSIVKVRASSPTSISRSRRESNLWLRGVCHSINGRVLSIGSGDDLDHEGGNYRSYFPSCSSYTTSEVTQGFPVDLVLDVRDMHEIQDHSFDAVYCSGVLEHVDDFRQGLKEITRILVPGGTLLLGLPFRQAIHMQPYDFWRFTEFGIRFMLEPSFLVEELKAIDADDPLNPAAYWVRATKC
ncbi:class I SAM-dependent methyltransferase [Synechococcus sp. CBW1107]|uniref:class I SAM-dependent methyltransferase n=1 Tax=Synechococcus sp. CBW1107 TaxID=2789857 RepID=UPI002AD57DE9|nr:class I SAM-dependent methyltransferase [Synechococcus sp. CBW1107]